MPLVDNAWYVNYGNGSSTGYYAVTVWPSLTAVAAGVIRRQAAAPAVGSERCFVCVVAGTTLVGEPSWNLTRGALTAEAAGPTWQECTGIAALNGDATNTPSWTITATPPGGVKGTAVTLGQVIKRDNGASYQICTVAGTAGSGAEPSFSDTAGVTTVDNTVTWTSLGVVGNFTGWGAPIARLARAMTATWGQAGNKLFLSHAHAETQASAMNLNANIGTLLLPIQIYCVNSAGSVPPTSADLATTATVSTTGANNINFNFNPGYVSMCYGVTFSAGGGGLNNANLSFENQTTSNGYWYLKNCALVLATTQTNGNATIYMVTNDNRMSSTVIFDNTTVQFGAASGQTMDFRGISSEFRWLNTPSAIAGSNSPTPLFTASGTPRQADILLDGIDLSAYGSGKTIFSSFVQPRIRMVNCKVDLAATLFTTPSAPIGKMGGINISASNNYNVQENTYAGTHTIETTIVRTGGASDGVTPIAWKLVTTANAKFLLPMITLPISVWNDVTGVPINVTVFGIWGGGAVPENDDIWMEAEYLGTSNSPRSSLISSGMADGLGVPAAVPADSASVWGGSTTKFKMTVTLTPQMKGPITVRVYAGLLSSTFYVDPLAVLS